MYRTDSHNNPTAFTTLIARQGGLIQHIDYETGEPFNDGPNTYFTARLLGDPIEKTIRVIDTISFYTKGGQPRWDYVSIFPRLWSILTFEQKKLTIREMYHREGGSALEHLFA